MAQQISASFFFLSLGCHEVHDEIHLVCQNAGLSLRAGRVIRPTI
jgi:hypothetical protein